MKKDILALFALVIVIAVVAGGTNVQSVDEYYLTHIDDITPESETVFISIRCDTVLDNYDELDPALQSEEFVPQDGVILPPTEYVLRPGDTVFDILDRAEGHHVHAALLCDGTHVTGGLNAFDTAAIDHALEQAAAAAHGKHALPLNITEHLLEQAKLTLKQVFILHEPSVVLCRITVKFRFHCQRVLSDFRISNLRGFFTVVFGSFFLEKLGVYLVDS